MNVRHGYIWVMRWGISKHAIGSANEWLYKGFETCVVSQKHDIVRCNGVPTMPNMCWHTARCCVANKRACWAALHYHCLLATKTSYSPFNSKIYTSMLLLGQIWPAPSSYKQSTSTWSNHLQTCLQDLTLLSNFISCHKFVHLSLSYKVSLAITNSIVQVLLH